MLQWLRTFVHRVGTRFFCVVLTSVLNLLAHWNTHAVATAKTPAASPRLFRARQADKADGTACVPALTHLPSHSAGAITFGWTITTPRLMSERESRISPTQPS